MRACQEELVLCRRAMATKPIFEDFVVNLNKTEYVYIVSHLAL